MNLPEGIIASGSAPIIVWHNGTSKADTDGKGRFSSYIGWATEAGKDTLLDRACAVAGIPQMRMRHFGGNESDQWRIGEELVIYPLTAGPCVKSALQFSRGDNFRRMAEAGLCAEWPASDFNGKPGRSHTAFRGIIPTLWDNGFTGLVEVGAKGMVTDALLDALADHTGRARLAVQDALGRSVSPALLRLPLVPGADRTVGKEGAQSTVTLIACGHPRTITPAYAQEIVAPDAIAEALDADWPQVQAWARGFLEPRQPRVEALDGPDASVGAEPRRIGAPALERSFLDMRAIAAETTNAEELDMIRLESLDARNAGRITAPQQAEIAKVIADRTALTPTLDDVPF